MRDFIANIFFALSRTIAPKKGYWITPNHVVVTQMATEVGMGFSTIGIPVALTRAVCEGVTH